MLGYRHAFHAGNPADVLKHLVLLRLLRHLNLKEKPYWYIDTHAGAGLYGLDAGYSQQNAEHADGIARLWAASALPEALADYVAAVRALNPDGELKLYPGSPYLATRHMRGDDRLRLFELHPTDLNLLAATFADAGKRVQVIAGDGFAGLKSLLPPPSRRGLILMDPSYEDKRDYARVVEAVKDGLTRFATGIYAIWYPRLARPEARRLPERLRDLPVRWLDLRLSWYTPLGGEGGMHGSGMFIVNPPWTLEAEMRACLPVLVKYLGQDGSARHDVAHSVSA